MHIRHLKLLPLLLCLAACGQAGPLYLPEKPPPAADNPSPAPAPGTQAPDRQE